MCDPGDSDNVTVKVPQLSEKGLRETGRGVGCQVAPGPGHAEGCALSVLGSDLDRGEWTIQPARPGQLFILRPGATAICRLNGGRRLSRTRYHSVACSGSVGDGDASELEFNILLPGCLE